MTSPVCRCYITNSAYYPALAPHGKWRENLRPIYAGFILYWEHVDLFFQKEAGG